MNNDHLNSLDPELNHLFWKDEILQVMYWMYGEDFGRKVSSDKLITLLNTTRAKVKEHLGQLVLDNYLEQDTDGSSVHYFLTEFGKKEAGQRFAGAFEGLQKVGHGECGPDCDCQWEGHDSCQHHLHQH